MSESSIARQLTEPEFQRFRTDFESLIKQVRGSRGELEIMFRDGYFNLYYQGNSLSRVHFRTKGKYMVEVNKKFLTEDLSARFPKESGDYRNGTFEADDVSVVLKPETIKALKAMVRKVGYGAEITFEQQLMAHNPASSRFLFVDRQIQVPGGGPRLDLLGLKRIDEGKYQFVVVEVKLGANAELADAVAEQLAKYIDLVGEKFAAFKVCYEAVYEQKKALGLLGGNDLPEQIEIVAPVEGWIVAQGRNLEMQEPVKRLKEKHPGVKLIVFDYGLFDPAGNLRTL